MYDFNTRNIRNVCLMAHGNAGKTTMCEALLHKAGAIDRRGRITEGSTISDYDPEEIKRRISISTSVAPIEWKGVKINIVDTPGYSDFVGEMIEGLRVCGSAVIMISGKSGVSAGTEKAWKMAKEKDIPVIFYVNKLDDPKADFSRVVGQLKDTFGKSVAPLLLPIMDGEEFTGFINIATMRAKIFTSDGKFTYGDIPADMQEIAEEHRAQLLEAVAECNDEYLEKYFAGEEFTDDEINYAIKYGLKYGTMSVVLSGSVAKGIGVEFLLDAIVDYVPAPDEVFLHRATYKNTNTPFEIVCDKDNSLIVRIFKTVVDPYYGKLSYFKVMAGTIKADSVVYNADREKQEKIGKLYIPFGKKLIEVPEVRAGDIGAVTKLTVTETCDCLCTEAEPVIMPKFRFPKPVLSMAIEPKAKGDEDKISTGIKKLMQEDPTFHMYRNHETHETIIEGMGEQHLDIIMSKLQNKFSVSADLKEPKVPYREAIRKVVEAEGKHKKQSGGHGQYGHVKMQFGPGEEDGLTFEEKVFGGSVPKNYFPAVEKGIQESMVYGVLAGYPMVNLKATLLDGSYHAVDSSELAFKTAANLAYKAAMPNASPVLLEPIGALKVTVPNDYTGDVIGDLNKRRGRVLGMNPDGNETLVEAEVPVSEMTKYVVDLKAITNGRGEFTFEFVRYEQCPSDIQEKVVKEHQAK